MAYEFKIKNGVIVNDTQAVDTVSTDGTLSGNLDTTLVSEKAIKEYVDKSVDSLTNKLSKSTGIIQGFATTTASATSVNIASGVYAIENPINQLNPISKTLNYAGVTGLAITGVATDGFTILFIDESGTISQQVNNPITDVQWRTHARISVIAHLGGSIISISARPTPSQNPGSRLSSFMTRLINKTGLIVSGVPSTLQINHTAGTYNSPGISTEVLSPDETTIIAKNPVTAIANQLQTGTPISQTTTIDVANYDLNGVVTSIGGGANSCTIQRVFSTLSGLIIMQYGQNVYTNITEAHAALIAGEDAFIQNPLLDQATLTIGYIISVKSNTDLTSPAAFIINSNRFGDVSNVGGGVAGSQSLQDGYDNSSPSPEILTNSTLGGLDVRRGSSADTDSVFSVEDGSSVKVLDVTGELPYAPKSTVATITNATDKVLVTKEWSNLSNVIGVGGVVDTTSYASDERVMTFVDSGVNKFTVWGDGKMASLESEIATLTSNNITSVTADINNASVDNLKAGSPTNGDSVINIGSGASSPESYGSVSTDPNEDFTVDGYVEDTVTGELFVGYKTWVKTGTNKRVRVVASSGSGPAFAWALTNEATPTKYSVVHQDTSSSYFQTTSNLGDITTGSYAGAGSYAGYQAGVAYVPAQAGTSLKSEGICKYDASVDTATILAGADNFVDVKTIGGWVDITSSISFESFVLPTNLKFLYNEALKMVKGLGAFSVTRTGVVDETLFTVPPQYLPTSAYRFDNVTTSTPPERVVSVLLPLDGTVSLKEVLNSGTGLYVNEIEWIII